MTAARDLLAGCCVSCGNAPEGDCGGSSSPPSPFVSDPGSLEPAGPLATDVQREIGRIVGREPTRDNRVRLLADGTQSYGAMLDLVGSASTDIRFENFIFRDDTVGRAFTHALLERAATGAQVRVLHDPFGSIMSRRLSIGRRFRRSAVRVRLHNPFRPTPAFFRRGRDHRKAVVGDRRRLIAGGMCLADVWSGNCIRHCTWRDSAILVEGAAALEAANEFDRVWLEAAPGSRGRRRSPTVGRPAATEVAVEESESERAVGTVPVRIVSGRPRERRLERVLTRVCDAAQDEILITNAYFLPTEALLASLRNACRRGVRVEILLPAHNNHPLVALAAEHQVGSLLESGVRIWLWLGPMIHAKTIVVDRSWSVVGSSNLDPLSLIKNLELDVEVHGSGIGEEMSAIFARDRTGCRPLTTEIWHERTTVRRAMSRAAFSWRRLL